MRSAAIAVLAAAAVAALLLVGVVIVRGGGGSAPGNSGGAGVASVDGPAAIEVRARPGSTDEVAAVPVVADLPSPAVLQLRIAGFDMFARAAARQCRPEATGCGNRIDVQFDERGVAVFQYLVREDFGTTEGGANACGPDDPPCLVTITSLDGQHRAEIQTVFGGQLPPSGAGEVEPNRGLRDGQQVTVELTGLPPGRRVTVTTCVAPTTSDRRRCGAPAPTADVVIGADGTARTELTVTRGPVGTQRLPCDDDHACGVVVLGDSADVRVQPVPIAFGALPGARYNATRLGIGIGTALLLAGVAAWLVRRTDWSAVGEAAAPEIDDAEYADLDAIVAALPDEHEDAAVGS